MALVYAALVYRQHCFLRDSRVEMIGMGFKNSNQSVKMFQCLFFAAQKYYLNIPVLHV